MDANEWYKLYRECGGSCGTPIDPYYENISENIIQAMRRRHAATLPVMSRAEYDAIRLRLLQGGRLMPEDAGYWRARKHYEGKQSND